MNKPMKFFADSKPCKVAVPLDTLETAIEILRWVANYECLSFWAIADDQEEMLYDAERLEGQAHVVFELFQEACLTVNANSALWVLQRRFGLSRPMAKRLCEEAVKLDDIAF